MKIFKISFFNVGNTAQGGNDYFDALKPGLILIYSDENYVLGFYDNNNQSVKIKKLNYDTEWWKIAADRLISKNKFDISLDFLSGLLQCADQQDQDGLYDHCQSENGKVTFGDPKESINKEVGVFCINQYIEGEFEYLENKVKINNENFELNDMFGNLDNLTSHLVYVKY